MFGELIPWVVLVLSAEIGECGKKLKADPKYQYRRVGRPIKACDLVDVTTPDPVILPQHKVRCNGDIVSVNFHAASDNGFAFQVWRPWGFEYKLLHSEKLTSQSGINKVTLQTPQPVLEGDVIGLCPTRAVSGTLGLLTRTDLAFPIPVTFENSGPFFYSGSQCASVKVGETCPQPRHSSGSNLQRRSYAINAMVRCYKDSSPIVIQRSATARAGMVASDCYRGKGEDYRGKANKTLTGVPCQNWDVDEPHATVYKSGLFPDEGLVDNLCRNPRGEMDRPWCYTSDRNKRFDYCDLQVCATSNSVVGSQKKSGPSPQMRSLGKLSYMGYDVKPRSQTFYVPPTTVILASAAASCDGVINSIQLYASQGGLIRLQVWRSNVVNDCTLIWDKEVKVKRGFNEFSKPLFPARVESGDMLGFTSPLIGSAHISYSNNEGGFYLHTHDCLHVNRGKQCKRLRMSSDESSIDMNQWSSKVMQSVTDMAMELLQRSSSLALPTDSLIRAYSINADMQCDQALYEDRGAPLVGRSFKSPSHRNLLPPPSLSGFASAVGRSFLDPVSRGQTVFLPGTAFRCHGRLRQVTAFVPAAQLTLEHLVNFVVVQVWRPGVFADPSQIETLLLPSLKQSGFHLVWESPIYGISNQFHTINNLNVDVKKGDVMGFTTKKMFGRQSSPIPFDTFGGFYYVSNSCGDISKTPTTAVDYLTIMTQQSTAFRTTCFDYKSSSSLGEGGRRTYSINADVTCS